MKRYCICVLWMLGIPLRLALTLFAIIPLLIWPQQFEELRKMVQELWVRP